MVGGPIGTLVGGRSATARPAGAATTPAVARASLRVCAVAAGLAAPLGGARGRRRADGHGFFVVVLPCEIALFLSGGPFNVAVLRSVPAGLRASAMALSIFAIHMLGDLWSPPLIGLVADHAPMAWAMLPVPGRVRPGRSRLVGGAERRLTVIRRRADRG